MDRAERPPVWLIVLLALQVLVSLGILYLFVTFAGSRVSFAEMAVYLGPLAFTLAQGGASWWAWVAGKRGVAIALAVLSPVLLLVAAAFLLGIGI